MGQAVGSHRLRRVKLPVALRRPVYRVGYRVLQAVWFLTRARLTGVKCLVTDGNELLLVRHTYGRRSWDLPGGTMRKNEPPDAAARREMAEELGLTEVDWEPIGELRIVEGWRRDTLHCFRGEVQAPQLHLDRGELLDARWFARAELPADLARYVIPILAQTTVRRR